MRLLTEDLFYKMLRFAVVGFSGVFIDFGITWLLKEQLRIQKYVANSAGFLAAATSNYYLNRIWTFASQDPHIARQYGLFIGISAVGLLLNNFLIWVLNDKMRVPFYMAKLLAIGAVTFWNFVLNYFITFR
ncbi:dolichol-phosphate mannosyltransferase [Catalinimonas alkaloidigena]|uniref:Dolichol-phosphate mannosyltransferase n=1 Tax=Catalinimonas alkaloidigena TaxID=1075417 RepID=A0A1G9LY65_9BACT|nr:GtrA family protein [Catalinimonas alkaloidigena]SDL66843.1 dolichol-phosphate mannosyltransferase [Catalinimonas alkaloidigena]